MIPETRRPRPPSGRAVSPRERRRLVSDVLRLDAKRIKPVLKGPAGTAQVVGWAGLEERVGLVLLPASTSTPRGLVLVPVHSSVPLDDPGAIWRAIAERIVGSPLIPVCATRPHFGGERLWFLCPCKRKVRILYRPAHSPTWACRTCWRLTYESRRLHRDRWYEGIDRLFREEERLSAGLRSRSRRRRRRAVARVAALDRHQLLARTFPRLRRDRSQ